MIYLDNNATTAVAPEAAAAMREILEENFGNPSSAHSTGRKAREIVDYSRAAVAALVGARRADEIVFTSGGTESDNWAFKGALLADPNRKHVIASAVEHDAVRKLCESLGSGYRVTFIGVNGSGEIDLDQLRDSLSKETSVVSVMLANNETGVIFPVAEIAKIVKSNSNALFHVDGVAACGKTEIDVESSDIDLFSLSAHKFHGPKGIGALFIRSGVNLAPMFIGGGQEAGRRAGTEAIHQIVGLATAAKLVADTGAMQHVRPLRDRLEDTLMVLTPDCFVNGTRSSAGRLPNTTNISFEGCNGEVLLAALDDAGICVSTGSACASGSHSVSHVLQAMEIPYSRAMGSIRFSLSRYTTDEEIDIVTEAMPSIVEYARNLAGYRPG